MFSIFRSQHETLREEVYEVDTDPDKVEERSSQKNSITKQGYLLKGPYTTSDRVFANIGSKSFKRRYCCLRQEVDGTYILELRKDEKQTESKAIVMDFCTEVVQNPRKGKFCFELKMNEGHKSVTLASEDSADMEDWIKKLSTVIYQFKLQEDKSNHSLSDKAQPPSPSSSTFGTLKGLEQSMNPQLIKYSRETDISIAQSRREGRKRLFGTIASQFTKSSSEPNVEPYKEVFGKQILVKCENIKFRLQAPIDDTENQCQIEPYITFFALYDIKSGRKLTENFYFDLNEEHTREMRQQAHELNGKLNGSESPKVNGKQNGNGTTSTENFPIDWIMYPRRALLNVTCPSADIFIVVRIEKILQGPINASTEPYTKAGKDPKLGPKTLKTIKQYAQRVGHYTMPFGWTARPLFRLYSSDLDTDGEFPAIYRHDCNKLKDEEILKILVDYRKPDKMNKLTTIPGSLKMIISDMNDVHMKSKSRFLLKF